MSELKVSTIKNKAGTGAPDLSGGFTIGGQTVDSAYGFTLYGGLIDSVGTPDSASTSRGKFWWNDSDQTLAIYNDGEWLSISGTIASGAAAAGFHLEGATRFIFGGGYQQGGTWTAYMGYVTIDTTGNASTFGNLTAARGNAPGSFSDNTYGVWAGGYSTAGTSNVIDYVTIATTGNASDFGDLTVGIYNLSGCSDATYGIIGPGLTYTNQMEYVTIASPGNSTDFGDLSYGATSNGAMTSDGSTALHGGGSAPSSYVNNIDYFTIATPGNGSDFGDLLETTGQAGAVSDGTYAVFGGGNRTGVESNVIDYVTIATPGNSTDFGDLTIGRRGLAAEGNETRGIFAGGHLGSTRQTRIDYITIATPGNATTFGVTGTGVGFPSAVAGA